MKAQDLKQISAFAGEAHDMIIEFLSPMLDERLVDQPVEAYAIYLANLRWAMYSAAEALAKLERMAETALPLWAQPAIQTVANEEDDNVRG